MLMIVIVLAEQVEIIAAAIYVAATLVHRRQRTITFWCFVTGLLTLSADLFWLRGHKTPEIWIALNIPFMILCYEKVVRNMVLSVLRKTTNLM